MIVTAGHVFTETVRMDRLLHPYSFREHMDYFDICWC
jgi:hypothetical protein